MNIKALGLAFAMAIAPLAASAATITVPFDVTSGDSISYTENKIGNTPGSRIFVFTANPPVDVFFDAEVSTLEFSGGFIGLTAMLGSTALTLSNLSATVRQTSFSIFFSQLNNYTETLIVSWTGVAPGSRNARSATLNLQGTASPVPVPAAGILLFSALGGLVAMRRRRKTAAPTGAVAA